VEQETATRELEEAVEYELKQRAEAEYRVLQAGAYIRPLFSSTSAVLVGYTRPLFGLA